MLFRRGDPLWRIAVVLTIGITWAGLLPSFSQSSFVALIAAIVVGGVVAWRRAGLLIVAAGRRGGDRRDRGLAGRPAPGVALARDERAVDARLEGRQGGGPPSGHRGRGRRLPPRLQRPRAPARQGAEGRRVAHDAGDGGGRDRASRASLLFAWLVAAALYTAFRRIVPTFDGAARLAFGLALVAILVHCLFYNALFEDPAFWGLLALVVVAPRRLVEAPA